MTGKFNLLYFFKGAGIEDWWKALGMFWRIIVVIFLIILMTSGIRTVIGWFIKPQQNVNKPTVITTPFSHVDKIDQTSTQISMTEKTWEAGFGGGVIRYDDKDGIGAWSWIRKRW